MKVYIVFKDGKPFNISHHPNKIYYENWLNMSYKNHKWKIKKCELKVIP
jgi:hypothetical protein